MNSYGLVFGGEKTSHDSGNDIAYKVVSGNDYTQVVIEGDEYILPKEAMQSDKVYDFVDKLPIEMLDEIKRSTNVFVQFPTLRQGDMVVCKNSVRNDDLHTISGTAKEISNYLQGLSACRMYAKGGYVEGGEVEDENEDSNIRFLTPMPPSKLNKTGIDSLAEIVGKDEVREVMSGALYAGNKRIVATDAHILVVLENQNYPNSLKGTIKSLWNKVPQERLVGVNYPSWEVIIPQTEQYQTAELSIDDVLAYAYGGVLQGKKIIAEKDYNRYEKKMFRYALRINIGNLEIFVDSLLLTSILRVFKANDVRRIVFHIGGSNQKPIKITTDKEHYGLIMPIVADGEYTFLSQKIFYPISQKDFRRMTETYGKYLKEFAKMVEDRQNNEMPTEFEYLATLRPISQAHPKENLIRLEEGGFDRYGKAIYSKPLSLKQIQHFSFFPATEIKMIGTKIYYYENYVADVKTDINSIYLSKDIGNGEIELEIISVVKFLEKIRSGEYRPINEMAEGGEISMNMPLLIRVLELAKEDVKEDKEIHFIAERLQSIADKGTLTMEDYDYISGLEDNPKIQKMYSDMLERGGGGEVADGTNATFDGSNPDIRFESGGSVLLAPNGKPSNLTPEQWHLVRTPEFKAWFGDWENSPKTASKVVDENGEPLVVLHKTSAEDFYVFDKDKIGDANSFTTLNGFFFGNYKKQSDDLRNILCFLSIKNPIVLNQSNTYFDSVGYQEAVQHFIQNGTTDYLADYLKYEEYDNEEINEILDNWEYADGVIVKNLNYDNFNTEFVAFEPEQIKLADGTNTTFDGNNSDIRFESGGSVLLAPNGKPSNLTPEQWHLVRTPEFKAWFGDWEALENAKIRDRGMDEITLNQLAKNVSKVVDKNGEPLVLYRGNEGQMGKYGFEFKLGLNLLNKPNPQNFGFFFTDELRVAEKYRMVDIWDSYVAGSITAIFLNANKVLDITDFGHKIGQINFVEGLIKKGIKFDLFQDLLTKIINFFDEGGEYKGWGYNTFDYFDVFPELRDLFLANGYKSIIFEEISRTYFPYNVFVAFEPEQIKLADGTNTTFDGNNPDIRYEQGGGISKIYQIMQKYKYDLQPKWEVEKFQTGGRHFLTFADAQKVKKKLEALSTSFQYKVVSVEENPEPMPEKDEINPEQIRAEIEALGELLQVLDGNDRQTIQDEIEILKLALGELEHTKLLAPNGKPSNLTPEQWHLVRTPEFKAWFGDWENYPEKASKVIDENGEPLVVFREIKATEKNHFNTEFQNSAISVKWQTNLDEILTRKLPSETKVGDEVRNLNKRGVVTEINNGIFKIKYEDGSVFSGNAFGLTFYGEKKPKKVLSAFLNIRILGGIEKLMVHSFGTQKDSGILSISSDDKNYFTFRSNQVKIADGTNTTFNGSNPDIRFESGGEIDEIDGTYSSLRNFIDLNPNYSKKLVELYAIKESEVEDSLDGELGYDEEILIALVGNNYRVFYDEESDEFEITKKKKKVEGSAVIVLANNKNKNEIFRVINEEINTEFEPRFAVLYDSKIVGGSTFFIQDEVYFFDISISEKARGLGIAKELIDKIIEDAKKMGCNNLSAEVVNSKLLAYLRKIGFSIYKSQDQNYAELNLT